MRNRIVYICRWIGLGAALVGGLGFLGAVHPALVSLGVFRLYAAGVLALCVALCFLVRARLWALVWAGFALGFWLSTGQMTPGHMPMAEAQAAPIMTHYQKNVLFNTPGMAKITADILAGAADTVTLQEVSDAHADDLKALSSVYPSQHRCTSQA